MSAASSINIANDPVDLRWSIHVESVTKQFGLGERMGLSAVFASRLKQFKALEDVSFTVDRGECFGIVGGNGSGKSTLLALIAAITLPTEGYLDVRGRVLPLLAVGAGF